MLRQTFHDRNEHGHRLPAKYFLYRTTVLLEDFIQLKAVGLFFSFLNAFTHWHNVGVCSQGIQCLRDGSCCVRFEKQITIPPTSKTLVSSIHGATHTTTRTLIRNQLCMDLEVGHGIVLELN